MSWSGGKDSTATIILAHEMGIQISGIVFAEVMYDRFRKISGENPVMMDFIYRAEEKFQDWGFPVYHLRSDKTDYLTIFHHVIQRARKHPENTGKLHGFPYAGNCTVRRDCKLAVIDKFLRERFPDCHMHVGICSDEERRLQRLYKAPGRSSLLSQYGYTQKMTTDLCRSYGLLSPAYDIFGCSRGGCWMCEFAKMKEHQLIKDSMPDVWEEFVSLESLPNLAMDKWSARTKETLKERNALLL